MERLTRPREAETKYVRERNELEITKAQETANIKTEKFNNMTQAIDSDTIIAIATCAPEMLVCIIYVGVCMCMRVCACASMYTCDCVSA